MSGCRNIIFGNGIVCLPEITMNENNPYSLKMSLNVVEMIYFYACHSLAEPLTDNCYLMTACSPTVLPVVSVHVI